MEKYALRPLEEADLHMVLAWRNSPHIHAQMLTDHQISWEEHSAWFARIKSARPARNLIFLYEGRAVGYIGYTEYDEENKCCSPGAYLGETEALPLDAGLQLFYMCLDYAFGELKMRKVETSVFADNRKAVTLDEFLGYKRLAGKEEYLVKNGQQKLTYRYAMSRETWLTRREDIIYMLNE